MKTQPHQTSLRSRRALRFIAAGILFLGAAALAATAMMRIKPPWAAPVVSVGANPVGVAIDPATNTIYVPNQLDNTISVIDGNQCDSVNTSDCLPIATMANVGLGPAWPTLDATTGTLYVTNTLTESGDAGNIVAVLNVTNCTAHDTSGCSQGPVALVTVGTTYFPDADVFASMAVDSSIHTLYVANADDAELSVVNTATCNALDTSGCDQVRTITATGETVEVDPSNHSVYVGNPSILDFSVFNGTTCNADTQSDCSAFSVAQLPKLYAPIQPAIEPTTHSIYLPLIAPADKLGFIAVIDGSTCNGLNHSGCGQKPQLVQAGSIPNQAVIDRTSKTVYVVNTGSASLSVIDGSVCNGTNSAGCPKRVPALAAGLFGLSLAVNPSTHTIYQPSTTNNVWVLEASQCNAQHPEGCTKFARTTPVGAGTVGLKENPDTHSLYVANQQANSFSIIDTAQCNQQKGAGCNRSWPQFAAKYLPRFFELNRVTNTLYLSLQGKNTVAVINGATCNSSTTSGCTALPLTRVGAVPQQLATDEATNTIYVVNQGDASISIIDGSQCNGGNSSGCAQSWPSALVGASPQGLTFNPDSRTLYVTNTDDNTVSVIDTTHCHAADSSGCTPVATFPVGAGPRAAGVVLDTNTLFVANRDDLSVSVIDGSTCNGTTTSGCPQVPPPAIVVGEFPETGGVGVLNVLGRSVAIDQQTHTILLPVPGDSDVVWFDGDNCTANNLDGCRPEVIPRRMGGFPIAAEASDATGTVYVTNDADATVSVFALPQ